LIKKPLGSYAKHSKSISILQVKGEFDLGVILEGREALEKDRVVGRLVCGRESWI